MLIPQQSTPRAANPLSARTLMMCLEPFSSGRGSGLFSADVTESSQSNAQQTELKGAAALRWELSQVITRMTHRAQAGSTDLSLGELNCFFLLPYLKAFSKEMVLTSISS